LYIFKKKEEEILDNIAGLVIVAVSEERIATVTTVSISIIVVISIATIVVRTTIISASPISGTNLH
jgi:hypothetical protein